MAELRIRDCEARDEESYVRLNLRFMDEVKQDNEYWSALATPTEEQLRGVFREALARPEAIRIFVAEYDGAVVAYANTFSFFSVWSMGPGLMVDDLFVDEPHRGAGIGRLLMGHVRAHAERNGYRRVQLQTEPGNTKAQALYRSLGFEPEDMKFFLLRL